jgi:hypothetical protein
MTYAYETGACISSEDDLVEIVDQNNTLINRANNTGNAPLKLP